MTIRVSSSASFLLLLLIWTVAALGCGMTVIPPAQPEQPVTVFITRHGVHSSLLLPRDDGILAQYGFSQFNWAALDYDQWFRAPFVLILPGSGTLGTRDITVPACCNDICCCPEMVDCHPPMDTVWPVVVSSASCRETLARLDARWAASKDTLIYNQKRQMKWVKDPAGYSLAHTCNAEVAQWLRELGCTVEGPAVTSDIKVRSPTGGGSVAGTPARHQPPVHTTDSALASQGHVVLD